MRARCSSLRPPFGNSRPRETAETILLRGVLVASLALAGCAAPMKPLADFGGATQALARSWSPFMPALEASCESRWRYRALSMPGTYDVREALAQAASECNALGLEAGKARLFAHALEDYAHALASVSGVHAGAFDDSLATLADTAGQLQDAQGSAVFDPGRVQAAQRLARAVAHVATARAQAAEARRLLKEPRQDLEIVVGAMKTYADAILRPQLREAHDVMTGELVRLTRASAAPTQADVEARLPWRLAQESVRRDLEENNVQARQVDAFQEAADQLLVAHAALLADFDRLGQLDRLRGVDDFVARVRTLRDDLK